MAESPVFWLKESPILDLPPEIWGLIVQYLTVPEIHRILSIKDRLSCLIPSPDKVYEERIRKRNYHVVDEEVACLVRNGYWKLEKLMDKPKLLVREFSNNSGAQACWQGEMVISLLKMLCEKYLKSEKRVPLILCIRLSISFLDRWVSSEGIYAQLARLLTKLATCLSEVSVVIVKAKHVSIHQSVPKADLANLINLLHTNYYDQQDLTGLKIQMLQPDCIIRFLEDNLLEEAQWTSHVCSSKMTRRKSDSEQLLCCELTKGCPLSWENCDKFNFELIRESCVQKCVAP